MQCSHCQWLSLGHSFLFPKCALGKLSVHWLMCLFGDIILCRGISDTVSCCGCGEVRVPAIARCKKCVWRIRARWQVGRADWNVILIIHYLRMRSSKNDCNSGPAKTGPPGPLATAMGREGSRVEKAWAKPKKGPPWCLSHFQGCTAVSLPCR